MTSQQRTGGSPARIERVCTRDQDENHGLVRMFRLRQDFPMEWHRHAHPDAAGAATSVELTITKDASLPVLTARRAPRAQGVELYAVPADAVEDFEFPDYLELTAPQEAEAVDWEEGEDVSIVRYQGNQSRAP